MSIMDELKKKLSFPRKEKDTGQDKEKASFKETGEGDDLLKDFSLSELPTIAKYKFKNGLKASQEELDVSRDKEVIRMIGKIDIGNVEDFEKIKVNVLLKALVERNIAEEILAIILSPLDAEAAKFEPSDFLSLKNSELVEVFSDFFILNPSAKKLFGSFR